MPEVSVIIPLYNKGIYIERTLRSVLEQTFKNFEVIVVDDGSTDTGVDIVKRIDDKRIKVIEQKNQGVSAARNRGILEAQSELIAFLDADDEWTPTFLEVILRLKREYPDAGIYATAYKKRLSSGKEKKLTFKALPEGQADGLISYFNAVAEGRLPVRSSNLAIPKKVFADVGNFSAGDWWGEDTEMWGRIAFKYSVAFSQDICMIYNIDTYNSAARKVKCIKEHPFVRTAKILINNGKVPLEILQVLSVYIDRELINTAKRNLLGGNKKLARENLYQCTTSRFIWRKRLLLLQTYIPHTLYIKLNNMINYLYYNI